VMGFDVNHLKAPNLATVTAFSGDNLSFAPTGPEVGSSIHVCVSPNRPSTCYANHSFVL
jgi:hypothetical protein